MTIVDTTVWIDFLRALRTRRTFWLDRELHQQRLGLTDLILCEVRKGFAEIPLLRGFAATYPGLKYSLLEARPWRSLRRRTIAF